MIAKRTFFGAALLGCTLLSAAPAETPDKLPKPTTYVADFAGVIDATSKGNIEQLATQVYEKAHATIVVVTVKSLDGQNIDEWTTALEDKWKVGPKNTDKGILMVFAIGDHKDRIEVGAGLEGILNDAKVGDIRRSMHDDLIAQQYGPGIQSGVQQIANVIAADANVTLTQPEQQTEQPVYHYQQVHHGISWIKIIFFLIFLFVVFHGGGRGGGGRGWLWFLLGSMMGGGFRGGGGGFGGGGGGGGGGGDFGGGFGGGSDGGGASGDF